MVYNGQEQGNSDTINEQNLISLEKSSTHPKTGLVPETYDTQNSKYNAISVIWPGLIMTLPQHITTIAGFAEFNPKGEPVANFLKVLCLDPQVDCFDLITALALTAPNYAQENAMCCHQHLKVVEYLDYHGCASAAELAICLDRHAPMLQRFSTVVSELEEGVQGLTAFPPVLGLSLGGGGMDAGGKAACVVWDACVVWSCRER
ncbi:hypothetical protein POM88_027529 [Heracleum sosnowskyi]|uniref:Uncharacterized protein n=1 Tax=Heracleum sosnowskyi TaxID=360622 RepID=A0AAD8IB63_9APIA|nr:hypothetical protein POM88_027529 [Heracleum sosnowskyi]